MKSRGRVADVFWDRFWNVLGGSPAQGVVRFGHPLATIFGQKSKKRKKKMNTVIGHCPGALQERKKNDF